MTHQSASTLTNAQRQALQWLSKLRDKDCTEQDQQAFSDWLTLAPEHLQAYTEVQEFWGQLTGLSALAKPRVNSAYDYVNKAKITRKRRNTTLLIMGIVVGLVFSTPDYFLKLTAKHYQTAKGEHINIQLVDGGYIEVNTDTKLSVTQFLGFRKVWLQRGEAWFNVKHNAEQPFEVLVGNVTIKDIGTQFNVFTDQGRTTVAVEEGEVAINLPKLSETRLNAGQQSSFDQEGFIDVVTEINFKTISAWRAGILIFKQQKLPEVLKQLARYHQVDFELSDPSLNKLTVSGRFSTHDLNEAINTLKNALNINVAVLSLDHTVIRLGK